MIVMGASVNITGAPEFFVFISAFIIERSDIYESVFSSSM